MSIQRWRLREWGSDRIHELPAFAPRCSLGSSEECGVHISDSSVFSLHAQLTREPKRWMLHALGESANVWRDGKLGRVFELEPGMEIRVGGTTLIVEDEHWIEVRAFLARVLGWAAFRTSAVDRALQSIRLAINHHIPLQLHGDTDMIPVAQAIHRRLLGVKAPFMVCDERRGRREASVRSPASYEEASSAATAAAGGSLCVRSLRQLPQSTTLYNWLTSMHCDVRLVICVDAGVPSSVVSEPIEVPSLTTRVPDLPRIIDEYAQDATAILETPPGSFCVDDRQWILDHASKSLSEIEKATLRCVALRSTKTLSHAATRLGMSPVSLSRWLARRASTSAAWR
ncbi:MAG TPA: FHA domain-containing protein [Kofleriaceae bacterium]|nr:FHA domain-containing protein [Kofleriaceae bacterium]